MTFSDKIKLAREVAKMTQHELAQEVGVSQRTIASYESGGARARKSTTEKLAHALKVSVRYLSDDDCTNPLEDIEKDEYIEQARELYGAKAFGIWMSCCGTTLLCLRVVNCPRIRRTLFSRPS